MISEYDFDLIYNFFKESVDFICLVFVLFWSTIHVALVWLCDSPKMW